MMVRWEGAMLTVSSLNTAAAQSNKFPPLVVPIDERSSYRGSDCSDDICRDNGGLADV